MSGGGNEWVERARLVKQAGLTTTPNTELAAVHAGVFPTAEPVRISCYKCVVDAYQAILRYLRTESVSPTSLSTAMSATQPAAERKYSFTDKDQTYRPHNSPVVFSNANLTDARVAMILKGDPAAAAHFGICEQEGQEFVASHAAEVAALAAATAPAPGGSTPPNEPNVATNKLTDTNSDYYKEEYAKLDALKRDELDALYSSEVKEGVAKDFANKGEVIKAILAHRAK